MAEVRQARGVVEVTQADRAALREAIRRAKADASHKYGVDWHRLEEISRFELVLDRLAATSRPADPAEVERDREDAERWRAFISSARFKMVGSANFDHSAYPEVSIRADKPADEWLHFGLEVWDKHRAGDDEQGRHGRNLLMAYVEHRRAALTGDRTHG